jgi:hypothetical protein
MAMISGCMIYDLCQRRRESAPLGQNDDRRRFGLDGIRCLHHRFVSANINKNPTPTTSAADRWYCVFTDLGKRSAIVR